MSLQSQPLGPVPAETARVAHAAYPKENVYLRLRDHLGTIYEDSQFAPLYPNVGQPAYAPWRLALISIMQFLEGLSIGRRLMQCEAVLIGNMYEGWN